MSKLTGNFADGPDRAESQRVPGQLSRALIWLGAALGAIVVLPVLVLIGAIPHNQIVKSQMQEFCGAFQAGQPLSQSEVVRRAQEKNFETRTGIDEPLNHRVDPASAVLVRKRSWSGTVWRCTVQFRDGRISAVEFSGRNGFL
jgi:hypothetical protein